METGAYKIKIDVDADTKKLLDFKKRLIDLQYTNSKVSKRQINAAKSEILYQNEKVKQMHRFKGEWLSLLFMVNAAAAPFQSMFDQVLQTAGVFDIFGAVLTAVILPALMPFINFLISIAAWMAKNREAISGFVTWLTVFMTGVGTAIAFIVGLILMFPAAISSATAVLLGIISAIIIAVIATLVTHWGEFVTWIKSIFNVFATNFENNLNIVKSFWNLLFGSDGTFANRWQKFVDSVTTAWSEGWQAIWDSLISLRDFFGSIFSGFGSTISSVIGGIADFFGLGGKQLGGEIKKNGMYYLHAGEEVVSNSPAGYQGGSFTNNYNIDAQVSSDVDIDWLAKRLSYKLGGANI
jgi:hypothetical protein